MFRVGLKIILERTIRERAYLCTTKLLRVIEKFNSESTLKHFRASCIVGIDSAMVRDKVYTLLTTSNP